MPAQVAILMRSKNEMPYLQTALEQLNAQTFNDFTLYAVDSGSTDGSVERLRNACGDRLETISPEAYIPGPVLNTGCARTTEPIIVLLNADAILRSDDALEKLIAPLLSGTADATYCRQAARPDARFVVAYDYERAYHPANITPDFFSAVACAFKRELWEKHPFPNTGYAEDAAWAQTCRATGARIELVPDSVVEHSHNYTLRGLYTKRYRQALTWNRPPRAGHQTIACLREIVRDTLHALLSLKPHTIPYNIAYRTTIHRAEHRGLHDRAQTPSETK